MPHMLMDHYDALPTNGILSACSGFIAFIVSGVDPVITGIIMPIAFFAVGKALDLAVKVWLDKRRR